MDGMITDLHKKIEAVCPIFGVSIDDEADRATWRVSFSDAATQEQMAAAQAVIDAYDVAAPIVPTEVSPYQARVALLQAGLLDTVESLMANTDTPAAARIAWEYATVVQRNSPFIVSLGSLLGLTEQQIDDLFIAAAQIT
jgi:hypothetical protein